MELKLVLLIGSGHESLPRSHKQILDALGYQIVTSSAGEGLEELISRLKPELILVSSGGDSDAVRNLERSLPEMKIIELESVPRAETTPQAVPQKATPRGDLTYNLDKVLYSRKEAAWSLGISIRSLDTLLASKQIAFRRLGRKVMIPAGEVKRISRQNTYLLGATPS